MPDHNNDPLPSGDLGIAQPFSMEPATGNALRSVYQKTVEEVIPDEMLDLLSKLD